VKGTLSGLLALVSLLIAGVCYWLYTRSNPPQTIYIILAIIFAILLVVFGGMFLSGRVNKTEDIHITE
jgi:ABC-type polysaccharide/polyol phosphate export permease